MSLLAPLSERRPPLSLTAARHVAALHLDSPDAIAALYDSGGARLQATPNFEEFFGIAPSPGPDRHRPYNWREAWLAERTKFVQATLATSQPMTVIEVASGYRVESQFATVQEDFPSETIVMQTARRVIRCPSLPGMSSTGMQTGIHAAQHATEGTWGPLELLSRRQIEVLRLVTKGLGNDEIGTVIRRTKRAVEWHIRGLFAKLRLSDRVQLHLVGMRAGLADIPDEIWRDILSRRFA